MKLTDKKSFIIKTGLFGFVLFWPVFCLFLGCSSVSNIKEASKEYIDSFSTPGEDLNKKVGIVWFENKTQMKNPGMEKKFMDYLLNTIQDECSEVILLKPGDAGYPETLKALPKQPSGDIDNLYLATTGRKLGLNAVVTGAIVDISEDQEQHGIWWFKNIRPYVRVQIATTVYDSETGAKLYDESFNHRVEIEELDLDFLDESKFKLSDVDKKTLDTAITEAFEEIASEMGEALCDALLDQPWRGFVTSVSDKQIIISAGKTAGLKPGDILEVYRADDIYQSPQGQRFFVPGLKTGEVKLTIVDRDISIAEVVSGEDIKPGCSVRAKE